MGIFYYKTTIILANYTSQPITLAPVSSSINLPLIQQVLQVKQGTYNQADAQIQQGLSSLEQLKFLRPQDNAYLQEKIQGMTASLDNLQDKDLSNPNVASNYFTTIRSVARDPFIVEAQANTLKYQQFQGMMQDIQKKNPEKFHQINYQFALEKAGLNEYMQGQTNSLGSFSYHNYADTNKNLLDRLKTIKDLRGDQTIDIIGTGENGIPVGEKVTKKLSGLTPQEIVESIPGMLTAEDDMQMRINGWWSGKQDPNSINSQFQSYIENNTEELDSQINEQKAISNNSTQSEAIRNEARQKVSALEAQKEQFIKNTENANLEQKGYFLYKNDYAKSIANTAGAQWSVTYGVDENYYAKQKLALEYEKLDISRQNLQLQREKLNQENGNFDGSGVSISPITAEYAQEYNPVTQIAEEFALRNNELTSVILDTYNLNSTPDEVTRQFDATMASMGYTPQGELLNPDKKPTISKVEALSIAFQKSNMGVVNPEAGANFSQKKILSDNIASDYNTSVGVAAKEVFNSNPERYSRVFINTITDLEYQIAEPLALDSFLGRRSKDNERQNRQEAIVNKAKAFIKKIGGEKNLKSIGSNTERVEEFRQIMEEMDENIEFFALNPVTSLTTYLTDRGFNKDVEEKAKTIIDKGRNTRSSFATQNQISFSNQKQKTYIAGLLPATETDRPFDPKQSTPITVYKRTIDGSPTLVVEQNVGYDEKGGKAKRAITTVTPQSAAFQYLNSIAELDESNRGLSASNSKKTLNIEKTPSFLEPTKAYTAKVNNYIQRNIPQSYFETGALLYSPANYTTAQTSLQAYQNALKGRYTTEQIDNVANHIIRNISNYKLSLKPVDGVWNLSLDDKNTKYNYREGSTGQTNLETPLLNLVNNYPQTIVMDFFLKELLTDQTAYNRIINNGR